jgi:sec-independent protein translocase protein TatA
MRLGPWEIGLVLVIVLIVFGVGKLPQIGGVIGKGLREFRKNRDNDDEKPAAAPPTPDAPTKKES